MSVTDYNARLYEKMKAEQDKTGKLISTKNDFRRHGYGISSIQKVADKYGGDVIIETQDGKFVLTVMMNIGEFNS